MQLQDALAARAEVVPFPGTAQAEDWRQPCPAARPTSFPRDARAVIYCPAPSVMSAGRRGTAQWVLEFEPRRRPPIDPLMGWIGGTEPLLHVRLRFPSREAAIAYAQRQGISFEVREPCHLRHGDQARTRRAEMAMNVPWEMKWALI